jgi:hypothetical protein
MPMMSLRLIRLAMVALLALGLAGCGRSESFRYKLTLAVNTPDGVKRGSSVTEWVFWEVSIPARGTPHKLRGEALYLDLGPGARPLIALLTNHLHPKHGVVHWDWPNDDLFDRLYGRPLANFMDEIARVARIRGPRRITPAELPDLVTFADVNDPKSVIEVDPNDLQATLGPNITWNEITLEMTDEPVSKGIELKLPWLPAYFQKNLRLDGAEYGMKAENPLANSLTWSDFDQSGDLKRSN